MVTGFFILEAYGFLRDFNLARSYSVFMSSHLVKCAFVIGRLARRDDANDLPVFALAMTRDEQPGASAQAQHQKALLIG